MEEQQRNEQNVDDSLYDQQLTLGIGDTDVSDNKELDQKLDTLLTDTFGSSNVLTPEQKEEVVAKLKNEIINNKTGSDNSKQNLRYSQGQAPGNDMFSTAIHLIIEILLRMEIANKWERRLEQLQKELAALNVASGNNPMRQATITPRQDTSSRTQPVLRQGSSHSKEEGDRSSKYDGAPLVS
jgi:hypothetical protein